MQPQPLFRVLAHPAFDGAGDHLRGRLDVDGTSAVAHRRDGLGHFQAEAMAGQADDADAMDGAFEMAGQPRNDRVGLARPAEELDVDPLVEELVDEDAHMDAAFERAYDGARRADAGRDGADRR